MTLQGLRGLRVWANVGVCRWWHCNLCTPFCKIYVRWYLNKFTTAYVSVQCSLCITIMNTCYIAVTTAHTSRPAAWIISINSNAHSTLSEEQNLLHAASKGVKSLKANWELLLISFRTSLALLKSSWGMIGSSNVKVYGLAKPPFASNTPFLPLYTLSRAPYVSHVDYLFISSAV